MYNDTKSESIVIMLILGCAMILLYFGIKIIIPNVTALIDAKVSTIFDDIINNQMS